VGLPCLFCHTCLHVSFTCMHVGVCLVVFIIVLHCMLGLSLCMVSACPALVSLMCSTHICTPVACLYVIYVPPAVYHVCGPTKARHIYPIHALLLAWFAISEQTQPAINLYLSI